MTDEQYLTVKETADFLKVKVETVRRLIKSGRLKGSKPGGRDYLIRAHILHQTFKTEQPLLTAVEVGERFHVHPVTVKGWARSGKMRSLQVSSWRTVRFREEDLEAFFNKGKKQGEND